VGGGVGLAVLGVFADASVPHSTLADPEPLDYRAGRAGLSAQHKPKDDREVRVINGQHCLLDEQRVAVGQGAGPLQSRHLVVLGENGRDLPDTVIETAS
jgi:hypothetical protein